MQQKGDAAGALAEIEQETIEIRGGMIGLPMAYHALGRKGDSDAALAALIAKYEKDAAYNIASVFAFRGDKRQGVRMARQGGRPTKTPALYEHRLGQRPLR